jgi:hypothetical protein
MLRGINTYQSWRQKCEQHYQHTSWHLIKPRREAIEIEEDMHFE